jgi:hypothetical protein
VQARQARLAVSEASYRKECHVRREAKTRDESYINKTLARSDARLSKVRASDSDIELIRTLVYFPLQRGNRAFLFDDAGHISEPLFDNIL